MTLAHLVHKHFASNTVSVRSVENHTPASDMAIQTKHLMQGPGTRFPATASPSKQ